MILRSVMKHVRDQNWFAVFLDFLIVVVGVFIGIQVANWNELRREEDLAASHLENLKQDFESSTADLVDTEADLVEVIEAMRTLLDQGSRASPSMTVEELNGLFAEIQAMPTFNWTSRTYDNLVGSGELRLIRDPSIVEELSTFRRLVRLVELVQATHEQELVETFQPWIIEHMDYLAVHVDRLDGAYPLPQPDDPDRILELLKDREFRNLLVQKWTIATDLLAQNRNLETSARTLLAALDSALDT